MKNARQYPHHHHHHRRRCQDGPSHGRSVRNMSLPIYYYCCLWLLSVSVVVVVSSFSIPRTTTLHPHYYYFHNDGTCRRRRRRCGALAAASSNHNNSADTAAAAVRELLYQDQQHAMVRRSLEEQEILESRTQHLEPATSLLLLPFRDTQKQKQKKAGTGFGTGGGGGGGNPTNRKKRAKRSTTTTTTTRGQQFASIVERDGVALIENVLSKETAGHLRDYVLAQQHVAQAVTAAEPHKAASFYGVEPTRAYRCDLQLSLLRGGYSADTTGITTTTTTTTTATAPPHILADALTELLHPDTGTLRDVFETLVTPEGELYELATVITHPGSPRQIIHPDLPFQDPAPLYVVFLALQDVTEAMGPTSFLIGSHTADVNAAYTQSDTNGKNAQLANADCRLSCLQQGDAVVFDARVLHCGNANTTAEGGAVRALFNFSFRNPRVTGPLGYAGSIRPGYVQAMTLHDMGQHLVSYEQAGKTIDPFAAFGSGLL